ncbi:MAG: ATP-binding protein [Thermodesulfobacteriota bacterium]
MSKKKPARKGWAWKLNLLVFCLVTVVVLLYSLGQVYYLRQTLKSHLRDNRQMVLNAVNRQTELSSLAEDALNDTIFLFLGNTARFLNFLNEVEPFQKQELASFADENGLAGVAIVEPSQRRVSGPDSWLPADQVCAGGDDLLTKKPAIFLLSWPRPQGGCVLIGYPDNKLQRLHQQFSLTSILSFLSSSPGIAFLEVVDPRRDYSTLGQEVAVEYLQLQGHEVVLGFDTGRYRERVRRIWQNFILYAAFFAGFGLLLTFIVYRLQQQHIAEIMRFERALAREQEDAALGRAAATIAHEVRNPLNAIGLGLQRIDLEAELGDEHRDLLGAMGTAMKRTNTIVEGLLRYSRPLVPSYAPVEIDKVLAQQLLLRQPQCTHENIEVDFSPGFGGEVLADADLLAQLFDNIIKNAIEAQPAGGWLRVLSSKLDQGPLVLFENSGFVKAAEIDRLAEPYFTGKTRGSGLGLAVCAKIVEAHNGSLDFEEIEKGVLRVSVWLPAIAEM